MLKLAEKQNPKDCVNNGTLHQQVQNSHVPEIISFQGSAQETLEVERPSPIFSETLAKPTKKGTSS